jgi:hypothetical protein
MGLLLLFQATGNLVMWAALLGAVGLTVWEVREHRFSRKAQLWWVLLVLLTHVPGYLALRIVTAYRGRVQA